MRVILEHSKPLLEMIEKNQRHKNRHTKPAWQRFTDAIAWSCEWFLLCVERTEDEKGPLSIVHLDRAPFRAPNMMAIQMMKSWAALDDEALAPLYIEQVRRARDKAREDRPAKGRGVKKVDGMPVFTPMTPEAKREIEEIRQRAEALRNAVNHKSTGRIPR